MAEAGDEAALRALEARLERATRATERLLADAAQAAEAPPTEAPPTEAPPAEVPPAGWQRAGADARPGSGTGPLGGWLEPSDAELLLGLLAGLRDRVPAELQQRLLAALRELLQALRALVDWGLERSERRRAAPVQAQDIPIL